MKAQKYTYTMLILLSIFSFLRCTPKSAKPQSTETDTYRTSAYNQHPEALYPIRKKDKWGYMNRKGEIVLPPTWDDVDDFYEGFSKAAILSEGQRMYGIIDVKGQWLVKPQYQKVENFSSGMVTVMKHDLYGYVDRNGKEVIPCQFEDAGPFFGGYAAIKQGGWKGFINIKGEVIVKPQFTGGVHHSQFQQGLAPVFGADEMTGFIDTAGNWIIDPVFHSAGNFKDGLAWAMIQREDDQAEHGFTIRGGFIDITGAYIIEPIYDFGWDFSEGYATCWYRSEDKKDKIWKVINKQGQEVLAHLPYRNVGSFHNGLLPIQDQNMKWGFMNIQGEVVIQPQYAGINHFKNGLARMEEGTAFSNSIVYINPKGNVVWKE